MFILLETRAVESFYTETHQITTNDFGLFSLVISEGNSTEDFSTLNWENGAFLKLELDANLDGNFTLMGVSSFSSVPYALFASVHTDIVSQLDSQSNQLDFYSTSLQELLNNGKTPKQIVNQGVDKERLYGLSYEGGCIFHLSESLDQGIIFSKEQLGLTTWGCENALIAPNGIGYGHYNSQIILNNWIHPEIAATHNVIFYNVFFAHQKKLLNGHINFRYYNVSTNGVNTVVLSDGTPINKLTTYKGNLM